jgi:hypothetical protein
VDTAADASGIPRAALRAIVWCESGWDASAYLAEQGGDGSVGLCQVLLSTAQGMGFTGTATDLMDAATNASYGARIFAGMYAQALAYAPNADPVTLLQMAASAYNGGFRPSLGFGTPATQPITGLCLRRDPSTGQCVNSVNVAPGQYGNQSYVDKFTSYFTSEGGLPASASGAVEVLAPIVISSDTPAIATGANDDTTDADTGSDDTDTLIVLGIILFLILAYSAKTSHGL